MKNPVEQTSARVRSRLLDIYRRLLAVQGHQGWWPADTPFEVAAGAVLAQNTAWSNADRAVKNLTRAGLRTAKAVVEAPDRVVARLLVPAGYFNLKAKRLKSLLAFLAAFCGGKAERLADTEPERTRGRLLEVWGVGPETADSILLYAAGVPFFVVDAYTRRIFSRLGMIEATMGYEEIRRFFERHLPRDVALYKDFHAQIVRLGHDVCRPRPRCEGCAIRRYCGFAVSSRRGPKPRRGD